MSDVNRRGFLGALAGVATVGVTTTAETYSPLVRLTVICPRCGCELPWPPSVNRKWPDWMTQVVETSCGCGYTTTVKFFAHV